MIEAIKEIFMAVGMCVVAVIIYGLFCTIKRGWNTGISYADQSK